MLTDDDIFIYSKRLRNKEIEGVLRKNINKAVGTTTMHCIAMLTRLDHG